MRKRKRSRKDRYGGDTSDLGLRFVAMGLVLVFAVAGILLAPTTIIDVVILVAAFVALVVLFAGTEKQARPLLFVLKPLIRLIQWTLGLLDFGGWFR